MPNTIRISTTQWLPDLIPYEMPDGGLQDMNGLAITGGITSSGYLTAESGTYTGNTALPVGTFLHSSGAFYTFCAYGTGANAIFRRNSAGTVTNVTPTYWANRTDQGGEWQFTQNGDVLVGCCEDGGVVVMYNFATDSAFIELPGNPPQAAACQFWKGYLILGKTTVCLTRGSDDTRVARSAFDYHITSSGIDTWYAKTSRNEVGMPLATTDSLIPADKWGIFAFYIDSAGSVTCTTGAANFTTGYSTEALAIAALPGGGAGTSRIGHVTIKTKTGTTFKVGTDGLYGGSSNNVASVTNYYSNYGNRRPNKLVWSALGNMIDFVPSNTTGAGFQDISDLEGSIRRLAPMSNVLAVVADYGICVMSSSQYWIFEFSSSVNGVFCDKRSVVSANNGIYFWTSNGLRFFDGINISIPFEGANETVMNISGRANDSTMSVYIASSAKLDDYNLIFWSVFQIIGSGYPTGRLIAYDYKKNIMSEINTISAYLCAIPKTWGGGGLLINRYISGASTYHTMNLLKDSSSYVTTREIADPSGNLTSIIRVRPLINKATGTVTVTPYTRMNEKDTATAGTPVTVSSTTGWVDMRISARYIAFKMTLAGGTVRGIDVQVASGSVQ